MDWRLGGKRAPDLAPHGIRVNTVALVFIATEVIGAFLDDPGFAALAR